MRQLEPKLGVVKTLRSCVLYVCIYDLYDVVQLIAVLQGDVQ